MSSSEVMTRPESVVFEADVDFAAARTFHEVLPQAPSHDAAGALSDARPLLEFRAGASEEEIADRIRQELRAETQQELDKIQAQVDERIQALINEVERSRTEMLRELSEHGAELAFAVAECILGRAVAVDRDVVRHAMHEAVKEAEGQRDLRLRVHPDDAESLREEKPLLESLRVTEVVADSRLSRGGCALEHGDRSWDATIEGRLEQLRAAVKKSMESDS